MKKEIKLRILNFYDSIAQLGEKQREFHQSAFAVLLKYYKEYDSIPLTINIEDKQLSLHNINDTNDHKIINYIYLGV